MYLISFVEDYAIIYLSSIANLFSDSIPNKVMTNKTLIDLYVANAKSVGVEFEDVDATKLKASTDMGNILKIKPSIHPLYKIAATGPNHTHEFTSGSCRSKKS